MKPQIKCLACLSLFFHSYLYQLSMFVIKHSCILEVECGQQVQNVMWKNVTCCGKVGPQMLYIRSSSCRDKLAMLVKTVQYSVGSSH